MGHLGLGLGLYRLCPGETMGMPAVPGLADVELRRNSKWSGKGSFDFQKGLLIYVGISTFFASFS